MAEKVTQRLRSEFPSCEACAGTGYHPTEKLPCEACQGTGRVVPTEWAEKANALNQAEQEQADKDSAAARHTSRSSSYRDRS